MSGLVSKRPRLWNFKDCQQEQAQRWILDSVNGAFQSQHIIRINAEHMYVNVQCMCVYVCVYGAAPCIQLLNPTQEVKATNAAALFFLHESCRFLKRFQQSF